MVVTASDVIINVVTPISVTKLFKLTAYKENTLSLGGSAHLEFQEAEAGRSLRV